MDIAKQNKAIDLMWVKQYLNMGLNRAKWAYMMDEIFWMEHPKAARETHHMIENWNPLTQGWSLKVRSTNIPQRIHNALCLLRKHRVELETLEPSDETWREIPIWLHRKANREAARIYTTDGAKCLKSKHQTHYMRQLLGLLENEPGEH